MEKLLERMELVGKQVPAADGSDYGLYITGYDQNTDDYYGVSVKWSTGEILSTYVYDIDAFKLSYRYCIDRARSMP